MSDPKTPNFYDALHEAHRQVETGEPARKEQQPEPERPKLSEEENRGLYEALLAEKVEKKNIKSYERGYYLSRFDTDPSFRKQAIADVKEWTASRTDEAHESKTLDEQKPEEDLTQSRAARLQRLRGITDEIQRERDGNDGPERPEMTRGGGRGR